MIFQTAFLREAFVADCAEKWLDFEVSFLVLLKRRFQKGIIAQIAGYFLNCLVSFYIFALSLPVFFVCVADFVTFKMICPPKSFITLVTYMWPLLSMNFYVQYQTLFPLELLFAQHTLKRHFLVMNNFVSYFVTRITEALFTEATFEWPFPSMVHQMNIKISFMIEIFAAFHAGKYFFVIPEVPRKRLFLFKLFVTNITSEFHGDIVLTHLKPDLMRSVIIPVEYNIWWRK